ncbi:MAG: hypothetical protein II901_00430, partial [Paludibacteraceae bacterium]|nr:hypothetical protein [Paludibacteraceae bacterium]
NTTNLKEMRSLRNTIKACEARINEISDAATNEAVAILAKHNLDRGEFRDEDGQRYQLQRTDIFDMANYNRYKTEDAVRWRQKKEAQDQARKYAAALTREMKGITDAFVAQHPNWQPDDFNLVLKVLD